MAISKNTRNQVLKMHHLQNHQQNSLPNIPWTSLSELYLAQVISLQSPADSGPHLSAVLSGGPSRSATWRCWRARRIWTIQAEYPQDTQRRIPLIWEYTEDLRITLWTIYVSQTGWEKSSFLMNFKQSGMLKHLRGPIAILLKKHIMVDFFRGPSFPWHLQSTSPFFSAQNAIFNVDVVVQCFTSSNPGGLWSLAVSSGAKKSTPVKKSCESI